MDTGIKKKEKVAYLTFDDGPSNNTIKILEILNLYDIKATFFVIGHEGEFHKNIYRQIVAGGHAIGNHSYSHDYLKIYSSIDSFKNDFYKLEILLHQTIGQKPKIFRFPGGSKNRLGSKYGGKDLIKRLAGEMLKEGYQYFDWNIDSQDSSVQLQNVNTIIESVLNGVKNNEKAVILMHDTPVKTTTIEALPEILADLKKQGFRFESLRKGSFNCQFRL